MKLVYQRIEEITIDLADLAGAVHRADAEAFANKPYDGTTMIEAMAAHSPLTCPRAIGPWTLKSADGQFTTNPFDLLKPPPRRRGPKNRAQTPEDAGQAGADVAGAPEATAREEARQEHGAILDEITGHRT